jgi:hypothetical protein
VSAAGWVPTRLVAVDGTVHVWSRRNADKRWQVRFETGVAVYPWATATRVKRTGLRVLRLAKGLTLADLRHAAWASASARRGVRS